MSQTPKDTEATENLIDAGDQFLGVASEFEETKPLVEPFRKSQTALVTTHDEVRRARRAMVSPRVKFLLANYRADRVSRQLSHGMKLLDGGKIGPVHATILPDGLGALTSAVGQTQVDLMGEALRRYEELARHQDLSSLVPLVQQFEAERTGYLQALDARRKATEELAQARLRRDLARQDFITLYIKMQGKIRELFPRDRPIAELFFYEFRSRSVRAETELEEPATPPTE